MTEPLLLHEWFERQAARTPSAVAAAAEEGTLTYAQLDARAEMLADRLSAAGARAETFVAVLLERSLDTIVSLLAILKSGAAYLPLDPAYPAERLRFMLEDSGARILITADALAQRIGVTAETLLDPRGATPAEPRVRLQADPGQLAYVIYTSGSTGLPKGVAIEHRSASTFVRWALTAFTPDELAGTLASTSICFDLSVFELFVPLAAGGTAILARNVLQLASHPSRDAVTLINTVPSAMTELVSLDAVPRSVRVVNLAGEPLKRSLVDRIYALPHVERVLNLYGPSEDTTYSTYTVVPREDTRPPSIGRPIDGTSAYILDERLLPVAGGEVGELYLGGEGLARGYWRREELTAERFLADPFAATPAARMYHTGDLVRLRADGDLEYLGRIDNQVKIRGFRIELGEIEAVLESRAGVRESAVIAVEDEELGKRLVAFVAADEDVDLAAIRAHLRSRLPEHMIPAPLVRVAQLPLTPNGKVDRRALAASLPSFGAAGEADGRDAEGVLAAIWSELLRTRVGLDDDLADLGAHSLLATRAAARARQRLGTDIPLSAFLEARTVRALGALIATAPRREVQAIPPVDPGSELPLSFTQQRMWIHEQLVPESRAGYTIPVTLRLRGVVDAGLLRRAFEAVVARHSALRSSFLQREGEPFVTLADEPPEFTVSDDASAIAQAIARPFELDRGPLIRALLVQRGAEEATLLLTMHHIVSDGWSIDVIVRDLAELYRAFATSRVPRLAELPVSYADYAAWQRRTRGEGGYAAQLDYWRKQLDGVPPATTLAPPSTSRNASAANATQTALLPRQLVRRLETVSRDANTTMFVTLFAAFHALVHRHTGQHDLCIGAPVAARTRPELEPLAGLFLNHLPLRTDVSGDPPFEELMARVRDTVHGALEHEDVPLDVLVEELHAERDGTRPPFFQMLFNMQNYETTARIRLPRLAVRVDEVEEVGSTFDVALYVDRRTGRTRLRLAYAASRFDERSAATLLADFVAMLDAASRQPSRRLSTLPLAKRPRVARRRVAPRNRYAPFRPESIEQSIASRFEEQARLHPQRIAVHAPDGVRTYEELDAIASCVASSLRKRIGRPATIGLLFPHGGEMIAAMLAVLKNGSAYVPLDSSFPTGRLETVAADAGLTAVVAASDLARTNLRGVRMLAFSELREQGDPHWRGEPAAPGALAYILYTSGSTGRPKGVAQSHRNILHHIRAYTNALRISAQDRLSVIASYAFDAAVMDIFGAILNGAAIHPYDIKTLSMREIASAIAADRITVYHSTPTVLRYLGEASGENALPDVRLVVMGGEPSLRSDFEIFRRTFPRTCVFVNGCGPTESTLSLQFFADHDTVIDTPTIPVGRDVDGLEVLLLNADREPVADLALGEMVIRSRYVALGYWNDPDATARKFADLDDSRRLYFTGDFGRRLPSGDLELVGRKDLQVKIRGQRIELPEIESALRAHDSVLNCVVLVDPRNAQRLIAYVAAPELRPAAASLREHLRRFLTEAMIPSAFVFIDAIPLTAAGKPDRPALASIAVEPEAQPQAAARNETDERIARIWSELLGVDGIGVTADFFEAGGHSLLAMRVVSRMQEAFRVPLALADIFAHPTIVQLADLVMSRAGDTAVTGTIHQSQPASAGERLPLTYSQERMLWFERTRAQSIPVSNLDVAVHLHGALDVARLRAAFDAVVARHDALRSAYDHDGQWFVPACEVPFRVVETSDCRAVQEAEARKAFDLATPPLVRVTLARIADGEHVLIVVLHHLVSDGWSISLLMEEVAAAYSDALADAMPLQYSSFARWQTARGDAELDHWTARLADAPRAMSMPYDHPRGASFTGSSVEQTLDAETVRALEQRARRERVTPYALTLAAFAATLHAWTGDVDLVLGSPEANRSLEGTGGSVGLYVITLLLRLRATASMRFTELARHAAAEVLDSYVHRHVSIPKLAQRVAELRDVGDMPLYQVIFAYQNFPRPPLSMRGLDARWESNATTASKFDLFFSVRQQADGGWKVSAQYRDSLFERETMTALVSAFVAVARRVARFEDFALSELCALFAVEEATCAS